MRPIRHEERHESVRDAWGGRPRVIEQDATMHVLNDHGGVGSCHARDRVACVCGCVAPVGGFCAAKGCGPVCVGCFPGSRCQACSKPCCPAHSVRRVGPTGTPVTLCTDCDSTLTRQRVVRQVLRAVLSPFISWEGRHGSR